VDLPESVLTISTLESLHLGRNRLTTLPRKIDLPLLSLLDATHNRLKELPNELVTCSQLQSLHLEGNPMDKRLFELASHLPMLIKFTHSSLS
jgi:Leucine-rich repeat (LRR) protein